jgi:hypothetical protein
LLVAERVVRLAVALNLCVCEWAHFEGALVSSSDVGRICENPTLEAATKRYELGCRASR